MKYFIYFSATGNGDYLAELLKEQGYTKGVRPPLRSTENGRR